MLLLEDNPTDVFVIKEVLKKCELDLDLFIAGDGREALRYLQDIDRDQSARCPALVLLDLNVPKINGIEVLRHLRGGMRCQQTPVVIVTSSSAAQDRLAAQSLGAEAYFQKSKDLNAYMELANVIRRVLKCPGEGEVDS